MSHNRTDTRMHRFSGKKTYHREIFDRHAVEIRNLLHALEMGDDLDGNRPLLDVYENCQEIVLEFDLPGFVPEDISLKVSGMTIVLEAHKQREQIDGSFICMERNFGQFYHTVQLVGSVDPRLITAEYRLGVLRVICPRSDELQVPIKEITLE